MATYELKPMSVGDILDTAVAVYRRNFGTLMTLAVVCLGIPILIEIMVGFSGGVFQHPFMALGARLIYLVGTVLLEGAVVWAVSTAYLGKTPTAGDALSDAYDRFGAIFVTGLLQSIITLIGVILFIVPGVIAACGLSVALPAVVLEEHTTGSEAIGRSWNLTKGFRGTAFVLILVVFVLFFVPSFAGGMVAAFAPALAPAIMAVALLVQLVFIPAFFCVFTLFYYDLRVRKEAFDLEQLSAHLSDAQEPAGA